MNLVATRHRSFCREECKVYMSRGMWGSYMSPPLSLLCSGPSKPKGLGCSIQSLPSRPFPIFVVLLWALIAIIWVTLLSEDPMLFALSRVFVADDWDKVLRSESKCRGQHALSGLHGLRAKHFIMFKNRIMGLLQEKKNAPKCDLFASRSSWTEISKVVLV